MEDEIQNKQIAEIKCHQEFQKMIEENKIVHLKEESSAKGGVYSNIESIVSASYNLHDKQYYT